MKEKFLILSLCLLVSFALAAQTGNTRSYTVKGQVVDSLSNESVPYATVRIALANAPEQPAKLLACDENGKFETSLPAAGEYIVSLQSIGMISGESRFILTEDKATVDLGQLSMKEDLQLLGEVTVSAQKPLVKMEVDKLTYNIEEDPDAKVNNMLDMLRKVPLITIDGNDNIQLKGSSSYKIYINGKPSNMFNNNPGDVLKSMPASSVKDIEVITDPGAKYDAEGVSGIINIITTQNLLQGYTGTIRASGSLLGRFSVSPYLSAKIGKLGLTGTYTYSYSQSPWNDSEYTRESFVDDTQKYLEQSGRNKSKGPYNYGYLEASYEFDTLNLLNVGVNLYNGRPKSFSELGVSMSDINRNPVYAYNRYTEQKMIYGSTNINVDYQHSTQKKGELLTISYRLSDSPDGGKSFSEMKDIQEYDYDLFYKPWSAYPQRTNNDAVTNEHTGQVDYVTPLFQGHTLETGVKYILRQNKSETERTRYDESTGEWIDYTADDSHFKHRQHIYSGYLGYSFRVSKFSIKGGVRAEGTALDVKFSRNPELNFDTDYFDIVPNATFAYQINQAHQLRLGYNMRIYRPGIWYLNPYVNDADPQNISYGNPNLKSEHSNSVNLNYSMFTMKFNMNASLSYSFVNDAIESYTFIDPDRPGVTHRTYDNIGKRKQFSGFLYASWTPVQAFRVFMNAGVYYMDYESQSLNITNDGLFAYLYGGMQYNLPKDFRIHLNAMYYSPQKTLQGEYSSMHYLNASLQKDFLNKNMTVSLNFMDPFQKSRKSQMTTTDPNFVIKSNSFYRSRDITLSISYKFGNLKEQIKKVQRSITNDDVVGSSGGGSTGGQGTTM